MRTPFVTRRELNALTKALIDYIAASDLAYASKVSGKISNKEDIAYENAVANLMKVIEDVNK